MIIRIINSAQDIKQDIQYALSDKFIEAKNGSCGSGCICGNPQCWDCGSP